MKQSDLRENRRTKERRGAARARIAAFAAAIALVLALLPGALAQSAGKLSLLPAGTPELYSYWAERLSEPWVLNAGANYTLRLTFEETAEQPFAQDETPMVYRLPDGLTAVSDGQEHAFSVWAGSVLARALYRVDGNAIEVRWDAASPNYDRLIAASGRQFSLDVTVAYQGGGVLDFGNGRVVAAAFGACQQMAFGDGLPAENGLTAEGEYNGKTVRDYIPRELHVSISGEMPQGASVQDQMDVPSARIEPESFYAERIFRNQSGQTAREALTLASCGILVKSLTDGAFALSLPAMTDQEEIVLHYYAVPGGVQQDGETAFLLKDAWPESSTLLEKSLHNAAVYARFEAEAGQKAPVFTIRKIDREGMPLSGASYRLEEKLPDGSLRLVQRSENLSTDDTFVYENLAPGDYLLTETLAPAGYVLAAPQEFTVTEESTVRWWGTPEAFRYAMYTLTAVKPEGEVIWITHKEVGMLEEPGIVLQPTLKVKTDDHNDSDPAQDAVLWEDSADYDIGDAVPFRLEAKLASNVSSYQRCRIVFCDTLDAGLTNCMDYTVTLVRGGAEIPVDASFVQVQSEDEHAFRLQVEWDGQGALLPHDLNGARVRVYFSAVLNENLAVGGQGNANTAHLEYSAHAGRADSELKRTAESKAVVYSYQLRLDKIDETGAPVPGASFRLEKVIAPRAEGEEQTLREMPLDEAASTETGFVFTGLDDGTYILTETAVMDGYLPAEPAEFVVTAEHGAEAGKGAEIRLLSLDAQVLRGTLDAQADADSGVIAAAFMNIKARGLEARVGDINDSREAEYTWQATADHDIGDTVPFRVTAALPGNLSAFTAYHFTFADTLDAGLTCNRDYAVTVGGEAFTDYTVLETENGFELTLRFDGEGETLPQAFAGQTVALTFTAVLNENAALGDAGNMNTVTLRYRLNPDDETDTETAPGRCAVYTYGLIVNKVDEAGAPLAGAAFRLEKKLADGSAKEIPVNGALSTASSFAFPGLDDGDYVLTETRAPSGYAVAEPIPFTVSAGHAAVWDGSGTALSDLSAEMTGAAAALSVSAQTGLIAAELTNVTAPVLSHQVLDKNDSSALTAVQWAASADYDAGDSVPLRATATLARGVSRYKSYRITLKGTLEEGLVNNRDYQVFVNGERITDYTVQDSDRGFDLTIRWGDRENALPESLDGAEVAVYYTATLTASARTGAPGNLSAVRMRYGSGLESGAEGETAESRALVFTYKLRAVSVDEKGQPLEGAAFTLEKKLADGTRQLIAQDITTSADGAALFLGLDDGDYALTQTRTPQGYLPAGEMGFTVRADHTAAWNGDLYTRTYVLTALSGVKTAGSFDLTANKITGELTANILNVQKPLFEKKVDDMNDSTNAEDAVEWTDTADCDIGDSVRFLLRAQLPANLTDYPQYHLTFLDTMEGGLTNNRDYRVTVNGREVGHQVVQEDDHSFEITLKWTAADITEQLAGAEVLVHYTARLNESAWVGGEGNVNTAVMRYPASPDAKTDTETEKQRAVVFTYRFTVTKADESGKPLPGAAFKLEKVLANGSKKQIPLDVNTSTETAFSFRGLDDGRYILTETRAPSGYLLAVPLEFVITSAHEEEWDSDLRTRALMLTELSAVTDSITVAIRVDSETMNLRATIIDERSSDAPANGQPNGYSNRFYFTKQWLGDVEDSIDFTLYNPNGSVRRKSFNKTKVSDTEYLYEAWFSDWSEFYVVEEPVEGYMVRYENVGAHAGETDRCYNGGTIINYKVPKTGDQAPIGLWIGLTAAGLCGLILLARGFRKRRRAEK